MTARKTYPFAAIVGQDEMKEGLILNTINPSIGGVLIRGEKGTAKSTAVRALAALLPEREVVKGCACGCQWGRWESLCPDCMERRTSGGLEMDIRAMQVVELPLSSTEDRVAGTLDIEHAISTGKKKFEPGVLAKANGNILYVDEINLLDDHIVDLLLDSAAMGMNFIERESVSYSHPARFILIGTMNPEEGDLRPQLLDRFGLMVDIKGEYDDRKRAEIIRRRLAFEKDSDGFCSSYADQNTEIKKRIIEARAIMDTIEPDDRTIDMAVKVSLHLGVDGHRADLTMVKAACTYAAWQGRDQVTPYDVIHVSGLVLPHRMRRNPFQDSTLDTMELKRWMEATAETL
ncbi:ATP-binding protein [Candidatus Methanoprimaticola sp. MG2]|uniref:ATP-binding protein n=1 Tax=Candidatus Methanoprimaticola sp. MG2 TaxID=3228838 RepID=UPI0039C73415